MSTASIRSSDHILVVGGSSGIGKAVAQEALSAGARVTIAGRSRQRLDAAVAVLDGGPRLRAVVADIAQEADVERLFGETATFDHLVCTAVDAAYQPIRAFEVAAARRVIDSKLLGPMLLAKHGARRIRGDGSMTFVSGIAAYRPSLGGSMIAAVNGALASLAAALAIELAPLRVNVVSPGWTDTPVWDAIAGENKRAVQEQMAKRLPVGRIGQPRDIAQAILAVVGNGFITGTVLHVDGGHRLV